MTSKSRRTGDNYERELRRKLEEMGLEVSFTKGSGAGMDKGDLKVDERGLDAFVSIDGLWEVKFRHNAEGFKFLYQSLADHDVLALRAAHKPWLIVRKL